MRCKRDKETDFSSFFCFYYINRLTSIQSQGLYDLFHEKFANSIDSDKERKKRATGSESCTESYVFEGVGCMQVGFKPRPEEDVIYVELSVEGCKYLCSKLHDLTCRYQTKSSLPTTYSSTYYIYIIIYFLWRNHNYGPTLNKVTFVSSQIRHNV